MDEKNFVVTLPTQAFCLGKGCIMQSYFEKQTSHEKPVASSSSERVYLIWDLKRKKGQEPWHCLAIVCYKILTRSKSCDMFVMLLANITNC